MQCSKLHVYILNTGREWIQVRAPFCKGSYKILEKRKCVSKPTCATVQVNIYRLFYAMKVWSVTTRLRNFYYPFLSFRFGQIKAKYFQRGEIVLFKWSTKRTLRSHTVTSECFYGYSTAFPLLDERWVRTSFWRALCVYVCVCVWKLFFEKEVREHERK
jgi:hypothetical protein